MLEELVGHHSIKQTLVQMLKRQNMPQAFLFHGPEGVGKGAFAEAFAQRLVAGSTRHLRKNSPDIRRYEVEEPASVHTIASMKELKEEVGIPPLEGDRKVFIIKEAHKMLPASSNALLKTLEEPMGSSVLILIAPSVSELLPTVVSRCCKIAFPLLQEEEVQEILMKRDGLSLEEVQKFSPYCFGSLQQLSKDKALWQETLLELFILFPTLHREEVKQKLQLLEEAYDKGGIETLDKVYELLLHFIKDIAILKQGLDPLYLSFKKYEKLLGVSAQKIARSSEEIQETCFAMQESHAYHIKLKTALETLLLSFYQK